MRGVFQTERTGHDTQNVPKCPAALRRGFYGRQITAPLTDGQEFPFDDGIIRVLFTPGHTRDSLSIDFPAECTTWLCETLGVPRPDGRVQPCFLSGYQAALDSVDRIAALGKRCFILPHTQAPLPMEQGADYLAKSRGSMTQSAALIRRLFDEGRDYDGIFTGYARQYWCELYRRSLKIPS